MVNRRKKVETIEKLVKKMRKITNVGRETQIKKNKVGQEKRKILN